MLVDSLLSPDHQAALGEGTEADATNTVLAGTSTVHAEEDTEGGIATTITAVEAGAVDIATNAVGALAAAVAARDIAGAAVGEFSWREKSPLLGTAIRWNQQRTYCSLISFCILLNTSAVALATTKTIALLATSTVHRAAAEGTPTRIGSVLKGDTAMNGDTSLRSF